MQGNQAYGDVKAPFHWFITLVLDRDEVSVPHPNCFTPRVRLFSTQRIYGWESPTTGLDILEIRKFFYLPGIKQWFLKGPAHIPVTTPNELSKLSCCFYHNIKNSVWIDIPKMYGKSVLTRTSMCYLATATFCCNKCFVSDTPDATEQVDLHSKCLLLLSNFSQTWISQ